MNLDLQPDNSILQLLEHWKEQQKRRDAPEVITLQTIDREQLVPALRSILAHGTVELKFTVTDILPLITSDDIVVELLIPYLSDPYDNLRWTLCQLFIGYVDPSLVVPLARVVRNDKDPDVRLSAAEALLHTGDKRALPTLLYTMKHDKGKDFEDRSIAVAARRAIAAIRRRTKLTTTVDPRLTPQLSTWAGLRSRRGRKS